MEGENYKSASAPDISVSQINYLLSVLQTDSSDPNSMLSEFGVTPERISLFQERVSKHLGRTADFHVNETMARLKEVYLGSQSIATTPVYIELDIFGQTKLWRQGNALPGLLPWNVEARERSATSFSPTISAFVAGLIPGLNDWLDYKLIPSAWEDLLIEYSTREESRLIYTLLDCLPEANRALKELVYTVICVKHGRCYLDVRQRNGPIRAIFSFRLLRGIPQGDWSKLLAKVKEYRIAIRGQDWLKQWLSAGPARNLLIEDELLLESSNFTEAWDVAQLGSKPHLCVVLTHLEEPKATLLLDQDGNCLIMASRLCSHVSSHWFDQFELRCDELALMKNGLPHVLSRPNSEA